MEIIFFKELKGQIEQLLKKELEEKERIKSLGGNRLKIEESDSSDEEEMPHIQMNESSKLNGHADTAASKKTSIKISEVESEDCEDSEEETENEAAKPVVNQVIEEKPATTEQKPIEAESKPIHQIIKLELPEVVITMKDKANTQFASGQYSDAMLFYTKAIEHLILMQPSKYIW